MILILRDWKLERKYPLIIFLVALFLRVLFLITYQDGSALENSLMADDAKIYVDIANNILEGKGYSLDGIHPMAWRVPGYSEFLSLILFLGDGHYLIVRLVQCILGAVTCFVLYLIGKEIYSNRIGIIASSIAALYYPFIQMPIYLVTETLSIFLLLFSLWWLVKTKKNNSSWNFIISGILLGIASLTRSTFFGFYLLLPFIFMITSPQKKKGLYQGILVFAGIILAISPWVIRNYLHFQQIIPMSTRSGFVLYQGHNPMATGENGGWWPMGKEYIVPEETFQMSELEKNAYFGEKAKNFIINNPKASFYLFFRKVLNMWRPYYSGTSLISKLVMLFSYLPVMILGTIGIFFSYKSWRKTTLLVAFIIYYVVVHAILVGTIRYRWPAMPFFFIFTAFTLDNLLEKYRIRIRF